MVDTRTSGCERPREKPYRKLVSSRGACSTSRPQCSSSVAAFARSNTICLQSAVVVTTDARGHMCELSSYVFVIDGGFGATRTRNLCGAAHP